MMNETKRTLIYVAVALVSVGTATATYYGSRPRKDAESSRIGTEFYPEFKFPTDAQVLRVVAYDKDTASVKEFKVEYKDGKWRIPSHHNYPADGKDRLARTAASVIGTSRTAFVSRAKPDQVKFDVVDPEDPDEAVLTGRGQKITISKNDGTVLAEYVVGKRKESTTPGQSDVYYVRATKADDPSTIYLANLKIDLSTKFGDWIEPDLLKVDRENLTDIKIDTYSIDEQQGAIIPGEVTELTRKPPGDTWTMSNLKPTEELKNEAINQLVSNLDGLRLVGVRPKPPGIEPDLSIDPRYARSQQLVSVLRNDMAEKGYFVGSDRRGGKERIFSKEGEIEAGTNEGLRYALHFGQIFTGTEFEVETGLSKDASKDKGAAKEGDKAKKAEPTKDKGKEKEQLKKNRYLMVHVTFDPKLVGEPPSKPLEPKKPQGLVLDAPKAPPAPGNKPAPTAGNAGTKAESNTQPAGAGKSNEKHSSAARLDDSQMLAMALPDPQVAPPKSDAKASDPKASDPKASDAKASDAKASDAKAPKAPPAAPAGSGKPASKPAPNAKPAAPAAPKPDPKAEYDKALAQYKKDLEKYENDKTEFEKKLKKGQDKVKQLNKRFGPWYYVISAESFENLRQGRASLVQPKGKAAEKKPGAGLDLHPPLGGMPER
jgi:hypothetical protein